MAARTGVRTSFEESCRTEREEEENDDYFVTDLQLQEVSRALAINTRPRQTIHSRRVEEKMTLNKLNLSKLAIGTDSLIGREREISTLRDCLTRISGASNSSNPPNGSTQQHCELVLIRGKSGTGKTALAMALTKATAATPRGLLAYGKFDLAENQDDSEPFSGLSMAFQGLCDKIMDLQKQHQQEQLMNSKGDRNLQYLDQFCDELRRELGDRLYLVTHIVPDLEDLLFPDTDENDTSGQNKRRSSRGTEDNADTIIKQTKYALRAFVRILNSYVAPLVIVVDDLQWADQASLELIEALLNDNASHITVGKNGGRHSTPGGMMVIGCYRSDEVRSDHRLTKTIRRLKGRAQSTKNLLSPSKSHSGDSSMIPASSAFMMTVITELEVGCLTLAQTNQAVMTLLAIENEETTLQLAEICHKRSLGNAYFLIAFVTMLKREGMLSFNLGLMQWHWDVKEIEKKTAATKNVVDLLKSRLGQLPSEMMHFLEVAACLGSQFDGTAITLAWEYMKKKISTSGDSYPGSAVNHLIMDTCKEGFMEKTAKAVYKWTTTTILESVLTSISASALQRIKSTIGLALLKGLTKEQLESHIFVVTNLLNSNLLETREKIKYNLIGLNLKSAEKAKKYSAFQNASRYCQVGISLLPEDSWTRGFDETLRLYSLSAEVNLYLGQTDLMEEHCQIILREKECTILDKLRAYNVLMDSYGNSGQIQKAGDLGFSALEQLGYTFPKFSTAATALSKLHKLHVHPVSKEATSNLSRMSDPKIIDRMQLLFRVQVYLYYLKEKHLYTLSCIQAVEWTMEYGYSDYSPASFASVGITILAHYADFEVAALFAENALLISAMLPKRHNPTASRICYTTLLTLAWRRPIQSMMKQMEYGYKIGMQLGDTESAVWCLALTAILHLMASRPLTELAVDCERYVHQMEENNRNMQANFTKCIWQLALNLSDERQSKPLSITGGAFNFQEESKIREQASKVALFGRQLEFLQIALYTFFGDYMSGAELALATTEKFIKDIPGVNNGMTDIFYKGLCCYHAAQTTYNKPLRFRWHAEQFRSTVHSWLKKGNPNVFHYSSFLDAEHAVLTKHKKEVKEHYEKTIVHAARSGFLQDAALANERYAQYLVRTGNDQAGALYRIQEALRYYQDWGATAKVKALREEFKHLLQEN